MLTNDTEEIKLNSTQLNNLEKLLSNLNKVNFSNTNEKLSWVARVFQWIDDNILSKTSRLWMYLLEVIGVVVIFIMVKDFQLGFKMIINANTEFEIQKAKLYIDAVSSSAPSIAGMVATICGAIPVVIATFRSLKKKWTNGATDSNGELTE